ncbi:hypothetical protein L1987_38312 [Smallanthus sonchifolius]|uniref:Uncharacterized protein n=1 Tax=Smallanthus sonchifolius TaxID=185202 RepID=A0ACB9HK77_9ASTR|nr:hypothetical protein L1987_38312 [Smallanthus sonchifolius]
MSHSPKSPDSPIEQEPEVPTVPSPEPKRRRMTPIDDTRVYGEPFHVRIRDDTEHWDWYPDMIRSWIREEQVPPPLAADIPTSSSSTSRTLPPLRYPPEQVLAAFVAKMDREISNMREAAGEITGLLQRGYKTDQRVEKLLNNQGRLNTVQDQLAAAYYELRDQVNVQRLNLEAAEARIEQLEEQLEAANAAEVEQEEEQGEDEEQGDDEEQDEDEDTVSDVTSVDSDDD